MECKKMTQIERDFEAMYDDIINRLDEIGEIKTAEACELTTLPYTRAAVAFRAIMTIMVKQNKAIVLKEGRWQIVKPNRRLVTC